MTRNLSAATNLIFAIGVVAAGSLAEGAGISGAIFTTTVTGASVNANHFDSKCGVYLDGGPGPQAPAHAAALPDGDYYFQVTDPNGLMLLSTDPVSNRGFRSLEESSLHLRALADRLILRVSIRIIRS